jgi:hypothetical protein
MDGEDWKRFEELVYQAGGVLHDGSKLTESQAAHAMAFHTLGLAILDINNRLLAGSGISSNKSTFSRVILPNG